MPKTTKIRLKYNDKLSIGRTAELEDLIKRKGLKETSISNLIALSSSNSKIIETAIRTNPNYNIDYFKAVFGYYKAIGGEYSDECICALLHIVDWTNSTQVIKFKDKKGNRSFDNIYNYIIANRTKFFDAIDKEQTQVVYDIVKAAGRDLLSYASKVCKYFQEYYFGKNTYYIYDFYVKEILKFYLKYYKNKGWFGGDIKVARDYNMYCKLMDELMNLRDSEFGDKLTKSKLDHIMWYSYRSFAK